MQSSDRDSNPVAANTSHFAPDALGRVLLIEDDELQLNWIANFLRRNHFVVHGLSSAEEAITELHISRYDLVITDLDMPGLTGFDLIERIRALDDGNTSCHVPIVVLSGKGNGLEFPSLVAGANLFCAKRKMRERLSDLLSLVLKIN